MAAPRQALHPLALDLTCTSLVSPGCRLGLPDENDKAPMSINASARRLRACQACAKRRTRATKCDQKQPCHRCEQIEIACLREEPERFTKAQLRQEKEQLQEKHEAAYIIFDALASGKQSDEILELLRRDESVHQIARQLKASPHDEINGCSSSSNSTSTRKDPMGGTFSLASPSQTILASSPGESISTSLFKPQHLPPHQYIRDVSDVVPIELVLEPQLISETLPGPRDSITLPEHQMYNAPTPAENPPTLDHPAPSPTTEGFLNIKYASIDAFVFATVPAYFSPCSPGMFKLITLPSKLVVDLLDAYFTWHAAPFPDIQRSRFVGDFLSQGTDHCSPALMRIVSCLGCRALGGYDPSLSTYASLGNRLFEESKRLLFGSPVSIPDVHACGLLALHQLGVGQYEDAAELAEEGVRRMASIVGSEMSQPTEVTESLDYQSALCSAVTLARFVRLILRYLTEYNLFISSPSIQDRSQEADDGFCLREPLQSGPSSPHPTYSLIEIIYCHVITARSLEFDSAHMASHASAAYQECLLWGDIALGLDSPQSEHSPFTHMLYHFCLLVLWRPFCPSALVNGMVPAAVCADSADAILLLAGSSGIRDHRAPNQFFLAHLMVLAAGLPIIAASAPQDT